MREATATRDDDRMLEMLADRALEGLSDDQSRALDALLGRDPGFDAECLDRAAGAIAASLLEPAEDAMPASVRRRLEMAAGAWTSGAAPRRSTAPAERTPEASEPAPVVGRIRTPEPRIITPLGALGWFAAAACLALAGVMWTAQSSSLLGSQVTLRDAREALIADAPADLVRVAWTATDDPAASSGVEGEIVWSDALNRGYMTFKGLAPNDAAQAQYQLWIFDESRSADHPVDGGVFDIPVSGGETVVPIDARLPIDKATLFAVTVERPGGVVVSSRERLPVLAKVGG